MSRPPVDLTLVHLVADPAAALRRESGGLELLRIAAAPGPEGEAEALNFAVAAACGNLLAFSWGDAVWRRDALAARIALHAARPALAFSFIPPRQTAPQGWSAMGGLAEPRAHWVELPDAVALLTRCPGVTRGAVVARRDGVLAMGGFHPQDVASEWEPWLRLARLGPAAALMEVVAPGSAPRAARRLSAMDAALQRRQAA